MSFLRLASVVSARGCLILSVALSACGKTNNVVAIGYTVSEFPMSGKRPWSCLPEAHTDATGAGNINWVVGTPLTVFVAATFEKVCGEGFGGEDCPDAGLVFGAFDATTWTEADGPQPGTSLGPNARYLESVGAGIGGLTVSAQGRIFPPLRVHAVAPAALQFQRVDGAVTSATLTPITALTLAAGESAEVVPYLVDESGTHLCGFPAQTATATGAVVTVQVPENMEGRANAPVQVTAGATSGSVQFTVGSVVGVLPVEVAPQGG